MLLLNYYFAFKNINDDKNNQVGQQNFIRIYILELNMSGGDAAPYAWAPTKSGGRLAHSVDQPIRAQVREDEDSDRSNALSTPLSTPGRPGRSK